MSSPISNTNIRARCLSVTSTPNRLNSWTMRSSWLTAGAVAMTTWLRTGTGSDTTSQKS